MTPDSFSDGGQFLEADAAVEHGLRLTAEGAHILDIAARGTTQVVEARVALSAMFGYSTDLRSMSKGRATFTMTFHAFDNLAEGG